MLDYRWVGLGRRFFARRDFACGTLLITGGGRAQASALVEVGLFSLTVGFTVIGSTALGGLLFAVGFPAAEGAAQVVSPRIARMCEKENAAVPAPGQAGTRTRLGSQHRSQQPVILQNQAGYFALSIPIGLELKMLLDPICKKPKLRLKMLTYSLTPPSYRTGAQVSRGGTGFSLLAKTRAWSSSTAFPVPTTWK